MGGSMELLAHWTRQVAAGSGEEADPWAVGDGGSIAAAAAAKAYRWVTIVDEVILVSKLIFLGSGRFFAHTNTHTHAPFILCA